MALGFLTNKEAEDIISGLKTRIASLEKQKATADARLVALTGTTPTGKAPSAAVSPRSTKKKFWTDRAATAEIERQENRIGELERQLAAARRTSPTAKPATRTTRATSKTPYTDRMAAIKNPPERTRFYKDHKKEILAEGRQ